MGKEPKLEYAGLPSDSIPDDIYIVQCTEWNLKQRIGRLFLRFQVAENGPYQGKVVFKSYNISTNGKVRPQSKYFKDWCRVHGSKPSKKGIQMSPRIFLNRLFKAKIVTKYLRDFETKEPDISEDARYSYVEEVLEEYGKV